MRALVIGLFLAYLIPDSSRATVFNGTHSLVIVGDGVEAGGLTAPPGFFADFPIGTAVVGSSQYDDTAPQTFSQCFNPNDAADCYPVYGGGTFELTIGAATLSSADLDEGGPYIILDDDWSYDPSTLLPISPLGEDLVGLSFFTLSPSNASLDLAGRWIVESIGFYRVLDADTIADPASLGGLDIYAFGPMNLSIHIRDSNTGSRGTVFALVPEPNTALLLGIGLSALAVRREKR